LEYINDYEKFTEQVKRFEQVIFEDGKEGGREEGIVQGIDIGIVQGVEIERKRSITDTAIKGIKAGYSYEIIQTLTGLTDDQINELRKNFSI